MFVVEMGEYQPLSLAVLGKQAVPNQNASIVFITSGFCA